MLLRQLGSLFLPSLFKGTRVPSGVPVPLPSVLVTPSVRQASKKASGGTRNPKQARPKHRRIVIGDGGRAFCNDILVHRQSKLWFLPGLNVRLASKNNLVARKNGTVKITCETPNLNWDEYRVNKFYGGRQGQKFFKKYFHVIPDPQPTRFKFVSSI